MYRPDRFHLLNAGLHRKLTPEEEAQLLRAFQNEPDGPITLEEELQLNHLLRQLPNAPVSSNFTAQVMQMVEQAQRPATPPMLLWHKIQWAFSTGLRRATVTTLALSLALLTYRYHQVANREELARSVAAVSDVATLPPVELLKDFETINRLDYAKIDFELLQALDLDR